MGTIALSDDGRGVVTLTLSNERRRNALDDGMLSTLAEVLEGRGRDMSGARLVVLRGAAATFCAGRDVAELADDVPAAARIAPVERLANAVRNCPWPTLAAVEGRAVGLGVALTAWCDLAIAAEGASFAVPEARLGIPPSFTAVSLLNALGARRAAAFVLTGRAIGAAEAQGLGLVSQVSPAAGFEDDLATLSDAVRCASPHALRSAKALLAEAAQLSFADGMGRACALATASMSSPDQVEGLAARRDRREPVWA